MIGTQLCKLKTLYKQAMLSDNWAKETILNFILYLSIFRLCAVGTQFQEKKFSAFYVKSRVFFS